MWWEISTHFVADYGGMWYTLMRGINWFRGGKAMKKVITALWCIFGICILFFIALVFLAKSSATTWRVFSIVMPIAGMAFWGAIILTALEYIRSKKEK